MIIERYYRDQLTVVNTETCKELTMSYEDAKKMMESGTKFYHFNDNATFKEITHDDLKWHNYGIGCYISNDIVVLNRESPKYNGRTLAYEDLYVMEKCQTPKISYKREELYLGDSNSSFFLDDIIPSKVDDKLCLTLNVRKHIHVGHKSDDEYHAVWKIEDDNLSKEDWQFIEHRRGY